MKETKLAKSKNKTEEETVWQRLRKKLRRPSLDYQDRELLCIGCITCVNQRYLVRDYHSVQYPVRRTTENLSWSVSLQWYSCLAFSSEHLVGFCRDSYCAYSDTEFKVNRKTIKGEELLILIQLFICWLFSIRKCTYNHVYAFTVFFFIKL